MKSNLIYFFAGALIGAAAGIALTAWLTDKDKESLKEHSSQKIDQLREELADKIEAFKQKIAARQ